MAVRQRFPDAAGFLRDSACLIVSERSELDEHGVAGGDGQLHRFALSHRGDACGSPDSVRRALREIKFYGAFVFKIIIQHVITFFGRVVGVTLRLVFLRRARFEYADQRVPVRVKAFEIVVGRELQRTVDRIGKSGKGELSGEEAFERVGEETVARAGEVNVVVPDAVINVA